MADLEVFSGADFIGKVQRGPLTTALFSVLQSAFLFFTLHFDIAVAYLSVYATVLFRKSRPLSDAGVWIQRSIVSD